MKYVVAAAFFLGVATEFVYKYHVKPRLKAWLDKISTKF